MSEAGEAIDGPPEEPSRDAAFSAFALAGDRIAASVSVREALEFATKALAAATDADATLARLADHDRRHLTAVAVWASSPVLRAELEGSRVSAGDLAAAAGPGETGLPEPLRRLAKRAGLRATVYAPVTRDGETVGTVEAFRRHGSFDAAAAAAARLAAGQVAIALRAFGIASRDGKAARRPPPLELVGDALAAAAEGAGIFDQLARLAAESADALGALVWRLGGERAPHRVAAFGEIERVADDVAGRAAAAEIARNANPVLVQRLDGQVPGDDMLLVTLRLGEPTLGALQLVFAAEAAPSEAELTRLARFGVRAAQTIRSSERSSRLALELDRSRALLAVVGQAIAQLSLAHTLETAIARVAGLLGCERVAIYLREGDRLEAAAARGVVGPHATVGETLLHAALGPLRGRGVLVIDDAARDRRLTSAAEAIAESGIESVVAVPLLAGDEIIGLLTVYPAAGERIPVAETGLLIAIVSQLAVAVQNARLHERAKRLGEELEQALTAERQAARHAAALYEISRSFAQSLSLDTTLDAVVRTVVEALRVDAAAIAMLDGRGENFVARALRVREPRLDEPLRAILAQPQPAAVLGVHVRPGREPIVLDRRRDAGLATYELLAAFLAQGATAAIVPVATPSELLATLTLLNLDPARPLERETIRAALSIAGQAALAIDNAHLYQQQKHFADTMQRSLLPRTQPVVDGLDVGHVYESSADVEVGGDVYDFLLLDGRRLAVVLGDVTGHGIEATADMALAKFAFRLLVRRHPRPGDFLAAVNDVVARELSAGKFITMTYLIVEGRQAELACASAGHPPPRLVREDGSVVPLAASGLALGIEVGQVYEEVREPFEPGTAVVLYTDGVVEARRGEELYGWERLDRFLAAHRELGAQELALALLEDCRSFAGELRDDCAIVVLRRPPEAESG